LSYRRNSLLKLNSSEQKNKEQFLVL